MRVSRTIQLILLAAIPGHLCAQQVLQTQLGHVTGIYTGWAADQVSVTLDVPYVNPGACPNTNLYSTDVAIADNKNQKAVLLTAYAMQKPVVLFVSGCSAQNYARIYGIFLPQ